ncbi:putative serine protease 46 [Cavia porcellus]|uniref:putative serine protease 46 n=1 Tax=Cavia porcellus TaxID=10141 RepID=UPI002FDF57CE
MVCGSGDLQACTPLLPFARIENQSYGNDSWFWACGHTNVSHEVKQGKLVEVGRWPWQVSILFLSLHLCSGSFIHQQWILTAAHCILSTSRPREYTMNVRAPHLPDDGIELPISHIVIPENVTDFTFQNIALLKLKKPVSLSLLQPICLPPPYYKPTVGSLCWLVGQGRSADEGEPKRNSTLQELATRIIDNRVCSQQHQFRLKGPKKSFGDDTLCSSTDSIVDNCQVWIC